jgi:hypothetical protein
VVDKFTPTSRGEHVLGEMKYVLLPILEFKENLNMAQRTVDRVHMSPNTLFDETDRKVQLEPCLIDVER